MNYNVNNHTAFNPLDALMRRKWQLAGCLVFICAMAISTVTIFAPKYEATAQVKVVSTERGNTSTLGALLGGNSSFNSQLELLKSDRVFQMALARINSDPMVMNPMKLMALRDRTKLRADATANVINIVGVSEKAETASAIANNLTSAFVETSTVMKNAQSNMILDQLTDQILMLEAKVTQKEQELDQFRKDNMIIGNETSYDSTVKVINELQSKIQKCETQKVDIQNQLAVLQKITMDDLQDPMSIPLKSIREDRGLQEELKAINELVNKEREYSRTYLPGHRELQKLNQKITIAKDNMARHAQTLLISLQKQSIETLAAIDKEKESINEALINSKNDALKNSSVYTRLNKYNSELADARKSRDNIHSEIQQYKLKQKLTSDPVVIVNAANVPESTAGLSARKRAGAVLLIGVIFSFVLVLSLEKMKINDMANEMLYAPMNNMQYGNYGMNYNAMPYQNMSTYNIQQPHNKNIEVLGRISGTSYDLENPISENMLYNLVHTYPQCRQAEQYREISTALLSRFSRTKQSVVITGNESKCGKTVLTCNLAHLLAQAGRKVLIVSTNPANDKLSKAFETGRTIYADLMVSGKYNISDFICHTSSNHIATLKLDLDNRPDTAELAQAISAMNWKLQSEFDWILYDSTSIGYNDTDNILQVIGKAIFVSRSTSNENIILTTEQIEQRGAVSLGCVEMPAAHNQVSYQHA